MDISIIKKSVKRVVLAMDYVLLKLFLPVLVKHTKSIHMSFDDVFFYTLKDHIYITEGLSSFLSNLNIPVDIFLYKESKNVKVNIDGCLNIRWNFHLPSLYSRLASASLKPTSQYARYHYFQCNLYDIDVFKFFGGYCLLTCNDNKRLSYDLSDKERDKVNKYHTYKKNGVKYVKTDIRLEYPLVYQLLLTRKRQSIVIFGHEWGIPQYRKRCTMLIRYFKKKNVKFVY